MPEMLLANYFSQQMLGAYAARLGKSDKNGTATLAERIAREWAKPSFAPPATSQKRSDSAVCGRGGMWCGSKV